MLKQTEELRGSKIGSMDGKPAPAAPPPPPDAAVLKELAAWNEMK